jgi:ferredoxin-thioredoxin reductase catalytic subunit
LDDWSRIDERSHFGQGRSIVQQEKVLCECERDGEDEEEDAECACYLAFLTEKDEAEERDYDPFN